MLEFPEMRVQKSKIEETRKIEAREFLWFSGQIIAPYQYVLFSYYIY